MLTLPATLPPRGIDFLSERVKDDFETAAGGKIFPTF